MSADPAAVPEGRGRFRVRLIDDAGFAGLCLWGVGVQTSEAVASTGLALTVVATLIGLLRTPRPVGGMGYLPLWACLGWALFAPLVAGRLPTGTGLARWFDWVALPAAAVALRQLAPVRHRRWMALCAGVFLLSCLTAGLQSYGLWPSLGFFQRAPILHDWMARTMVRVYEQAPDGRFMGGGLLFHRLKFAHVGGLVVLAAFPWALRLAGSKAARTGGAGATERLAAAVALIGFYAVAAFPFARGALLALTVSLAVVWVLAARRRIWAFAAAGALVLAVSGAVLVVPSLRDRFRGSLTSEGNGNRAALWSTGVRAVQEHPWVGVGVGRFHPGDFAPPGVSVHEAAETVKAHDQYLTWAAEAGVPGLVLFLLLLAWIWTQLVSHMPEGAGALGAVLFFALLSVAHDPLFHAPFSMALVLALAHGMGRGRRTTPAVSADPRTQE